MYKPKKVYQACVTLTTTYYFTVGEDGRSEDDLKDALTCVSPDDLGCADRAHYVEHDVEVTLQPSFEAPDCVLARAQPSEDYSYKLIEYTDEDETDEDGTDEDGEAPKT